MQIIKYCMLFLVFITSATIEASLCTTPYASKISSINLVSFSMLIFMNVSPRY